MSGICGIIRFDGQSVQKEEIQDMLNAMPHRGNDSGNISIEDNIGFGHKMLYTTPESLHESQPLKSNDGLLLLTADMRIDNRDELIEKLELKEDTFTIVTDADLILLAYQKWRKDSPKQLIGDFAYVIWDPEQNHLFCVRDRLGIKPFYYYIDKKQFVFSSEIPSIFTINGIKRELDIGELKCYMENIFPENTKTYFKNILRIPGSTSMTVSDKDKNTLFSLYWDISKIDINWDLSFEDAKDKFLKLFIQSIQSRMRSAYPIGFDLSGGLDSSSIVCTANSLKTGQTITPFSLRYGSLKCDEGEYIEEVSRHIGKKVVNVDIVKKNLLRNYSLDFIYKHNTEWPVFGTYSDGFPMAEYASKKNIRIMLSGVGGDDILTGNLHYLTDYLKHFKYFKLLNALKKMHFDRDIILQYLIKPMLPKWLKSIIKTMLRRSDKKALICHRLKTLASEVEKIERSSLYKYEEINKLYGPFYTMWFEDNPTKIAGLYDVEVSFPFFDTKLIEFSMTLPPEFKGIGSKYIDKKIILREAMKGILPEKIRTRANKSEFSESILFQVNFIKNIEELLKNALIVEFGLIMQDEIDEALSNFNNKNDEINNANKLWELVHLEMFLKTNLDIMANK